MSVAYQICVAFLGIGEENEAEVYFLEIKKCYFLAVQDSSITDIVCLSVGLSQLTIRAYTLQSIKEA